jgi:hypothetical protein
MSERRWGQEEAEENPVGPSAGEMVETLKRLIDEQVRRDYLRWVDRCMLRGDEHV